MSNTRDALKRTPLSRIHESLGAKMIDFGGWWMPVQYSSILDEHRAVRTKAGIFDLSHMGEIEVRGAGAQDFLQRVVTNNLDKITDGQALYSPMCLPSGGIVDDLLIYRRDAERFFLVVNASNIEKDFDWMREQVSRDLTLENCSDATALVAIQGPHSRQILSTLTNVSLESLAYYRFLPDATVCGVKTLLARTGYTGELGYELFCDAQDAARLWNGIYEGVRKADGLPVGLGARDTLRLEMRYALYGNDIDETTTPLEAGLGWTVVFDKTDFLGADALRCQKAEGLTRRLVGFHMLDRAVARSHYRVFKGGEEIGMVTSGAPSPSLGVNIGLAYVSVSHAKIGSSFDIEIRGKRHPARVVRTPFYISTG